MDLPLSKKFCCFIFKLHIPLESYILSKATFFLFNFYTDNHKCMFALLDTTTNMFLPDNGVLFKCCQEPSFDRCSFHSTKHIKDGLITIVSYTFIVMDQFFMNTQHLRLPYNIPPPPPLAPLSPIMMDPSSASWRLPTPFQFQPHMIFPTVQCEELYNASLPLNLTAVKSEIISQVKQDAHPYPYSAGGLSKLVRPTPFHCNASLPLELSSSSILNLTAVKSEIISPVKQDAQQSLYSAGGLSKLVRPSYKPAPVQDRVSPLQSTGDSKSGILHQPTFPPVPAKKTQCRASTQVPTVTNSSLEYTTANELYLAEQWKDIQTYIATTSFPQPEHQSLQKMWLNSVYEVYRKKKTKLTPADRYRLRKQQPVPVNILSPVTNNHFTAEVRSSMEQVFHVNSRPVPETVKMLVETTGLTAKQIRNFFYNKRQRS